MYDHTLHHGRKYFCCYCFQAFSTLKCHIEVCFKINGKQRIIMPKNGILNLLILNLKIVKEK